MKFKYYLPVFFGIGLIAFSSNAQAQTVGWATTASPGLVYDATGNQTSLIWELGYFNSGKDFSSVTDYSTLTSGWNSLSTAAQDPQWGVGSVWTVNSGAAEIGKAMYIFAHSADGSQVFLVSQGVFSDTSSTTFDMATGGAEDANPFTVIFGNIYRGAGAPILGSNNATAGLTLNPALTATDYSWEVQAAQFGAPSPVPEASTSLLVLVAGVSLTLRRRRK